MQFSAVFAAAMLAVSVSAQLKENPKPAAAILNNPVGKQYVYCPSSLDAHPLTSNSYEAEFNHPKVVGTVKFTAGKNGEGVDIVVSLAGFEGEPGPFGYHIHDQPVPLDGNCTLTKAHLDPYGRGQLTPCVKSKPETCEVGDLAGKHGKIPGSESGA